MSRRSGLSLDDSLKLLSGEFDYCVQDDTLTIKRKVAAMFPLLEVVRFKRVTP